MFLFITSVGLSVTMGLMGFVNLAHGAFAMAGGYVVVTLTRTLGVGFVPVARHCCGRGRRGERRVRARALSPALQVDRSRAGAAHHRSRVHGDRHRDLSLRADSEIGAAAGLAAGRRQSRLPQFPELSRLSDRARRRAHRRALVRIRAHQYRRQDPRRGRQPAHGGIGRHQCRSAVHADLRGRVAALPRSAAGSPSSCSASRRALRCSIWCCS